jgi:hypothetical protein
MTIDAVPGRYSAGKGGEAGFSQKQRLSGAYLAGLATGFWSGKDELEKQWQAYRHSYLVSTLILPLK